MNQLSLTQSSTALSTTPMAERNRDVPADRRIEYRMGINVGDVVADGGDLLGDGVNIAARLEALAKPGGICISGSTYEQVRRRLKLDLDYMGPQTLKNIADPVPTYRIAAGLGRATPTNWRRMRHWLLPSMGSGRCGFRRRVNNTRTKKDSKLNEQDANIGLFFRNHCAEYFGTH